MIPLFGIDSLGGYVIDNGLKFRNEFHLDRLASAELFVPCGGRPEAVDLSNVTMLLKEDGSSRFKWIVEGANLFFTQEARLRLEKAGAIIFKDASANKGGVTSSSLEVLAALSLTDEEFAELMQVQITKDSSTIPIAMYDDLLKYFRWQGGERYSQILSRIRQGGPRHH